jgi:hypothetical protein
VVSAVPNIRILCVCLALVRGLKGGAETNIENRDEELVKERDGDAHVGISLPRDGKG